MANVALDTFRGIDQKEYNRRIWAWTMYDWANSAFATTILAAVFPIYFSQVAGASLPSATIATAYWSTGLSISLFIIAIFSPILGTISDVMRGKKRFLAVFVGIGIISTAFLVLVTTGDWILASIFGILGRIGFSGANIFYDALLPHVAKEEDRDKVSTRGYAMGYLGGGILLAINVAMIQLLPGTWGPRLSFLSVAVWWAIFSIPIFRRVPEPPAATAILKRGQNVLTASFKRLGDTLTDIRRYRELFKYLIAFLIYNDGIGTIIGVAAIYGAELGFGAVELVLALLLVQFVGIPFSLIFGRLPSKGDKRRPFFLTFILFNLIALPLVGGLSRNWFSENETGVRPAPLASTTSAAGEGIYSSDSLAIKYSGVWDAITIPAEEIGRDEEIVMQTSSESGARMDFPFIGERIETTFILGPEHGIWAVYIDGQPLLDEDSLEPILFDSFNPTVRYEVSEVYHAGTAGEHLFSLVNTERKNPDSQGFAIALSAVEVLPLERQSNLGLILGLILAIEVIGFILSYLLGPILFSSIVEKFNTKRSILLALSVYVVIAIWGFFLDSTIEYWFMAWMVAVVQGGSQALSRSLYAAMSPAAKSGEFFGLFGIMEKFSAIIGPLLFAAAAVSFGSSRPAVLSLILLFLIGGGLLIFVNVEEGKRVAKLEDAELLKSEVLG